MSAIRGIKSMRRGRFRTVQCEVIETAAPTNEPPPPCQRCDGTGWEPGGEAGGARVACTACDGGGIDVPEEPIAPADEDATGVPGQGTQ